MSLDSYAGDLALVKRGIIFQQVNCLGVMGAGLAKNLANKYPGVKKTYLKTYNNAEYAPTDDAPETNAYHRRAKFNLLGKMQLIKVAPGVIVGNSYTQLNAGRGGHYTDEKKLINNLARTAVWAKKHNLPVYVPSNVGSGLAGGNKSVITQGFKKIDAHVPNVLRPVDFVKGKVPYKQDMPVREKVKPVKKQKDDDFEFNL